jgi:hypothetical protein
LDVSTARECARLPAEQGPTYPNDCSAFFDRDAEIVRHPHAEFRELDGVAMQ